MMCKKSISRKWKAGFSLVELIAAVSAALVLILGIGIMLAHSQQGFNRMYKRVHSSVVEDAYSARRMFDRVVRKSTTRRCDLVDGSELYVYYYSNPEDRTIPTPDSYARFYLETGGEDQRVKLFVDYGGIPTGTPLETLNPGSLSPSRRVRLARDVQVSASDWPLFSARGRTVQLALPLDNGKEKMLVTSSAVRHNK